MASLEALGNLATWLLAGVLSACGIALGGMAHESSLSFFDPWPLARFAPSYTPSVLVVFIFALLPGVLYWQLYKRPARPWFGPKFNIPTSTVLDRYLVGGSLLFGIGWALGGFCPGPSFAGLITGQPVAVAFSYGMQLASLASSILSSKPEERHWAPSLAFLPIPAVFYFYGPTWFPLTRVSPLFEHSLLLYGALGGSLIGIAALLLMQGAGRILGLSSIWRTLISVKAPLAERLPQVAFYVGFIGGSALAYILLPAAFSSPPYATSTRSLLWTFLGGVLVAIGTDWANGCTSGHGVCGLPRLSARSWVAVPTFMAAVFITMPIVAIIS